jgi:hypothetical protein
MEWARRVTPIVLKKPPTPWVTSGVSRGAGAPLGGGQRHPLRKASEIP